MKTVNPSDFMEYLGCAPVKKSQVEGLAMHDEIGLDISKNHYDIIFMLKSGRDIPWFFSSRDTRDAVALLLCRPENLNIRSIKPVELEAR